MNAVLDAPAQTPPPLRRSPHVETLKWTCEKFELLGESGAFDGLNVILVDGEILTMPIASPAHDRAITIILLALLRSFGGAYFPRVQSGLPLGSNTNLVPDLAFVAGSPKDFVGHPTSASLIVEVAVSSLSFDLGEKSNLYAKAGIAEYWVIDVEALQLHVHREPVVDSAAPHGFRYASVQVLNTTDSIAPLAAPDSAITVGELMP